MVHLDLNTPGLYFFQSLLTSLGFGVSGVTSWRWLGGAPRESGLGGSGGGGGHVNSRCSPGRRPITLRQGSASPWSPGETHQRAGGNQGRNQRLSLVPGDVEGAAPQRGLCPCHTLWGSVEGAGLGAGGCCVLRSLPSTSSHTEESAPRAPLSGIGGGGGRRAGTGAFSARGAGAPELTRLHALPSKRASPSTRSIATTTRAPARSWQA